MMDGHSEAGMLTGQAGAQIEALQEAFRVLSGAGTLKEHSVRFCAVVGEFFGGDDLGMNFARVADGFLIGYGGLYTYDLPAVLVGPKFTVFGHHAERGTIVCTGTIAVQITGSKLKSERRKPSFPRAAP